MKIFIRILLSAFILVFGAILLLQTPFAKYQIKKTLITEASKQGIELSIEKLDGNLPLDWKAKNVSITAFDETVSVQTVKVRLALLPLFKKKLEITQLKMIGGKYHGANFDGNAKVLIDLNEEKSIKISQLVLDGDDLTLQLEGKVQSDFTIQEGSLSFRIPDVSLFTPFFSSGSITGSGNLTKFTAHFEAYSEDLTYLGTPLEKSTFLLDGERTRKNWKGALAFDGGLKGIPFDGSAQYHFSPSCRLISIEDFKLDGPDVLLFGRLDVDPSFKSLEGTIFAKVLDVKTFSSLLPDIALKGQLGAKFDFQSFSEFQDIKCQIEAQDLGLKDFSCDTLTFESSLYDVFGDLRGEFSLDATDFNSNEIQLEAIQVRSIFEPGASPFKLFAKGNWEDPFVIRGDGCWLKKGDGIVGTLENFNGSLFQKDISLNESCSIEWDRNHFKLHSLSLDIGGGHLSGRVDLSEKTSLIKLKANDFPLECIPIPYRHFSMAGIGSFDIDLVSWEQHLEGSCNIALKRALFLTDESAESLTTKGSVQIHLSGNMAQVHAELKATGGQFAHFSGTLPILYQHFPFHIHLDDKKPFSASFLSEGKLEDLFNFINIGHQRIEGWVTANLFLSRTLEKPMLQGDFSLSDGLYENYFSGTQLKKITAKGYADRQNIVISDLYAVDGKGGSASCRGNILLQSLKKYPFNLDCTLNEFEAVTFDTIAGNFSGNVTISGDKQGAIAKGKLKVDEATFHIPDTLPTALPDLPITFVNPPETLTRKKNLAPASSPIQLDLDLEVPGRAYVEGRGLSAELKGNLHITGNFADIMAKGNLALVKGEYIFSGKVFGLTQGEVIFNDSPTPSSYISLTGECDLPDVLVSVILRGPLTSPNLSFQSSPQLPTSSLLSQILFNTDFSEINAAQALQLAQTVISLSSHSGPDILEKIRKTLGIDRLTLVTSEKDPGKTSIQIGKYLMRGVLLTLSQGAENRNVSVEVDLKKGVRLQAEMNEDQGKFSLKWHHHY
ncbi:MAG: translocation/assembly module TamB domain-containing protein [Simkaniaceae bacterium]|nr:translocation/assembly module TamB domain-containing protein [Candidatus Sacchlamyda saccharinae]